MIPKEIKSLQHPTVKHLVKLRKEKQYRDKKNRLLLEGKKMIFEYGGSIELLVTTEEVFIPAHLSPKVHMIVSPEIIEKIATTKSPEPYLAEVLLPKAETLAGKKRILALDGIRDPGNLGTLVRTALAFGFEGVFLINSADIYCSKALRAAKGATFHLPTAIGTEEQLLDLIKQNGLNAYIADAQGSLTTTFNSPLILILGNEAHGPSATLKNSGALVSIPIAHEIDSLNVAVAGGILMHKIQEAL